MPGIWHSPRVWASGLAWQPCQAVPPRSSHKHTGPAAGERCQPRIWPCRAKQLSVVPPALFARSSGTSPVPAPCLLPPAKCESPTWCSGDAELSSWAPGGSLCLLLALSTPAERLMEGLAGLVRTGLDPSCPSHHGEVTWQLLLSPLCEVELLS